MDDGIKSMTQDNDVKELIEALQMFNSRREADSVYELASYIDSLEEKLDQAISELNIVKKQLVEVKELNERKSLKNVLKETAGKLEDSCNEMKVHLSEIKLEVKAKSREVIQSVKEKGITGLSRLSEFIGINNMLKKMKSSLERDLVQVNSVIEKIDTAGLEMKKAAAGIKNVARALLGKELIDVKEKNGLSISDVVKAPWKANQKIYTGMLKHVEGAIVNTEILFRKAEQIKTNVKNNSEEVGGNEREKVTPLTVAEGHVYNSEVFETYEWTINASKKDEQTPSSKLPEQMKKR